MTTASRPNPTMRAVIHSSEKPASPTVLVGFAEALAAPEVVWSLVDMGCHVVAFARKGRPSALRHSRHVVCHEIVAPEADLQKSVRELEALCASLYSGKDNSQRILFPLDDKGVWLSSKMQLGTEWLLAGPSGPSAELALNKCIQTAVAREAGFAVPKTSMARTATDVLGACEDMEFPVILKAAQCVPVFQGRVYSCRKWICANPRELDRAVTEWGERVPLLIQPFIIGTGAGIFGLATSDEVRAWSGHRRLRMMNPQGSGSSACVSQLVSEDLKVKTSELIKRTGWRGMFMIELLRDRAGVDWFVELNGRPWGSLALSRRQGLEYPAWQVQLAMNPDDRVGIEPPLGPPVVCRNLGREMMHLLFVLRGPKSHALVEWPSVWKTIAEVAPVRRRDTVYNWRGEDPKVFLADCYYTIHDNLFKTKY
jgi:hypothetical protein